MYCLYIIILKFKLQTEWYLCQEPNATSTVPIVLKDPVCETDVYNKLYVTNGVLSNCTDACSATEMRPCCYNGVSRMTEYVPI